MKKLRISNRNLEFEVVTLTNKCLILLYHIYYLCYANDIGATLILIQNYAELIGYCAEGIEMIIFITNFHYFEFSQL